MGNVLFIYVGMHEAHKPFVDAINADVYPVYHRNVKGFRRFIEAFKMARKYPDYDVYLLEGGMPMFPAYLKKKMKKNITMIGLLADETFINLVERQPHYSFAETLIHRMSAKCLDGAISVSPMVKSYAEKVIDVPIEIARPPIPKENFIKLGKIKPDLESNIIVSIGQLKYSKGIHTLTEQFSTIRDKFPELELWIIGKAYPKDYRRVEGIKVLGYVNNLPEIFKKASLFIHAGGCSAYPVITLEAMRAGLPIIVSTMIGTKEIVKRVETEIKIEFGFSYKGNKFIQPLSNLSEGILAYYSLDIEIRESMSKKYREESEEFEPAKRARYFRESFNKLLNTLQTKRLEAYK